MNAREIIIRPIITEHSYDMMEKNTFTFEVAKNAHKFGFIVRYPAGKTRVTGYAYEPWHLRHVGVGVATHLKKTGLTLDEYLGVTSSYAY